MLNIRDLSYSLASLFVVSPSRGGGQTALPDARCCLLIQALKLAWYISFTALTLSVHSFKDFHDI